MSNLNFEDKITKILTEMSGDYWEHMTCSDECGKKTMENENLNDYIDQIKQLISEIVGEVDSLEEVIEDGKRYLKDKKGNKTPFGYPYADTKEKYILEELRHAFNLKKYE